MLVIGKKTQKNGRNRSNKNLLPGKSLHAFSPTVDFGQNNLSAEVKSEEAMFLTTKLLHL